MVVLGQLIELRVPEDLRGGSSADLDAHIQTKIVQALKSTPQRSLAVSDDKAHPDLLEGLSPSLDTLPCLYVLNSQIQSGGKKGAQQTSLSPGGSLWEKARLFVNEFDPIEIRYAGQEWTSFLEALCLARPNDSQGTAALLDLIANAMTRLDPSLGTFTISHLLFLRKCLDTHSFDQALRVARCAIHSFPPKAMPEETFLCSPHYLSNGYITTGSGLTAKVTLPDVQEYQMLCAMTYIGLGRWADAKYHFEHVLCTPTSGTANGFMYEAYKKWLLISLLAQGDVQNLPRSASDNAVKTMKSAAKPYEAIVEAFKHSDSAKLRAEFHEAQAIFADDANVGLVQNVINHHRGMQVLASAKIYSAKPVARIAEELGLSTNDTESYLHMLINRGFLQAEIEAPTAGRGSVIRFLQKSEQGLDSASEAKLYQQLQSQANRIKALDKHLAEVDYRLALTKEYAEHERRTRQAKQEQKEAVEMGEGNDTYMSLPPGPGSDDEERMMVDAS